MGERRRMGTEADENEEEVVVSVSASASVVEETDEGAAWKGVQCTVYPLISRRSR